MKKQYIVLMMVALQITTSWHVAAVNGTDTPPPPAPLTQQSPNTAQQQDNNSQSKPYNEINWKPQLSITPASKATVPQLASSFSSSLHAIGETLALASPEYVTLETNIKGWTISDENKAARRREVDRGIIRLICDIDSNMTTHEKDIAKLLQVTKPQMKTLATIANHAQLLNILDPSLQDQVTAWLNKYYHYVKQLEEQHTKETSQYRTTIQELGEQLGFCNDMKLAIESLKNLNFGQNSQQKLNNDTKISDMIATLATKLESPTVKTAGVINNMKTIAQEAKQHGLHPSLPALTAARQALINKRNRTIKELREHMETVQKELSENKSTEELLYTSMKFYNSPDIEPLSSEKYENLDNMYVAISKTYLAKK